MINHQNYEKEIKHYGLTAEEGAIVVAFLYELAGIGIASMNNGLNRLCYE